jgi:ActR/RegA family two-component response regulator
MIKLIITADDGLYERLAARVQGQGDEPRRAANALDGLHLATAEPVSSIIVDMAIHAADTLIETLRNKQATCNIPLFAVQSGGRIPFELRRLCTDVLEAKKL